MLIFTSTLMMSIFKMKSKYAWEMIMISMMMITLFTMVTNPLMPFNYFLTKNYSMDSMSFIMILLSSWITQLIMMASYEFKQTKNNYKLFSMTSVILFMTLMLCFSTNNLLMFYVLFELSLIPILMLIMLWGYQPERKMASMYIVMYTTTASLPLLMMILNLLSMNYSNKFSMCSFYPNLLFNMNSNLMWFMLMVAFFVKLPLFSVHMWLPKAHVEAPVAGSMILAAILLKLGGYGLLRMNKLITQSMFPISYTLVSIATVGGVITNILCIRQSDLKALIAYSSIGHMSLLVIGTMSNSKLGQFGSLIIMLTHALSSSCLFLLTNLMYKTLQTRSILMMNSAPAMHPSNSLMWTLSISSNMALPPSLAILSEILIMMSSFFISKMMIIALMMISFSAASYSMYLYSMMNHGNQLKLSNPSPQNKSIDLLSTTSHLWPLLILVFIPTKLMSWC